MAFESLSDKLAETFKKLRSKGRLTNADVKEAMREVRLALLEADVSYKVVKNFTKNVTERAVGSDVLEALNPAQQVIKIVNEELVTLMGSDNQKINISSQSPSLVMLVGLQGAGKTTNGAKLAAYMKKQGKHPLLAACDIYRPAAIDQLETVGSQLGMPVFQMGQTSPVDIAKAAIEYAKKHGNDLIFLDTAGRLHIDEELMQELQNIKEKVKPHQILLVVDALTGQDAVNAAKGFNEKLDVDGIIMTKMDGDARGGAALSARKVTGKPILFLGTGEKYNALEAFHPDRMASRILGMGDLLSLIENAERDYDEAKAEKQLERLKKNQFTLEDFLEQMGEVKRMGGIGKILEMMPGVSSKQMQNVNLDESEKEFRQYEAIIYSMTKEERQDPSILNASRRKRIAAGCGLPVSRINTLIKRYEETKKMLKQFSRPGAMKKNRMLRGLF